MACGFAYCVYNRDSSCVLAETRLNSFGMCEECIIVTIEEKNLEIMKEKQLRELENKG